MNKSWLSLVAIGIIIVLVVIGWDVFLTFAGGKADYEFNVTEISNKLYGGLEQHLRADPKFGQID